MPEPTLEQEGAIRLAEALEQWAALHGSGRRELVRTKLASAIDLAGRALAVAEDAATIANARATLAKAHAARAEDAYHGAGQLSLSAQRAPTREACDEGWRRVEAIAAGAEESARLSAMEARELSQRAASTAAERAQEAARNARKIVEQRNHAYTFHTDSAFSFGEGWHVAAAAVLEGVTIQIEPGKPWTRQAERFLRDAGLGDRLQPYRSRPRTVKQTTAIVARAFADDAIASRHELRAAFLGDEPIPQPVVEWIDRALAGAPSGVKVLLWIRNGTHDAARNTKVGEIFELARRARSVGLVPVLIGDAMHDGAVDAVDMTLFWTAEIFRGEDGRRRQLQLFEHLANAHGVVAQIGVTTAGMDGPALMGLPTIYLTDAPNVRLRAWVGVVPGYREIVRESGYLDRVGTLLDQVRSPSSTRRRSISTVPPSIFT